jgi:hypothetical protein
MQPEELLRALQALWNQPRDGYKWLEPWITGGPDGLQDRDSRPHRSPLATAPEVVEAILEVRRKYTDYGAKKVTWYLERNRPDLELPSRQAREHASRPEASGYPAVPSQPPQPAARIQCLPPRVQLGPRPRGAEWRVTQRFL